MRRPRTLVRGRRARSRRSRAITAIPRRSARRSTSRWCTAFPSTRPLVEGDILSIDMGAKLDGFFGDCAVTVPVGRVSDEAATLLRVTEEALFRGIDAVKPGARVSDIGAAVQQHVEANGFSVVREFVGHGIGTSLHEEPQIANYGPAGQGPRLAEGMVLAIEPMVNVGDAGGEGAGGRLDRGDARRQPVGALRAHGGRDRGRVRDSDAARGRAGPRAAAAAAARWSGRSDAARRMRWHECRRVSSWRSCRAGCIRSRSTGRGGSPRISAAGTERNFVRLLVGDRVVVELTPRDLTRGRIVRKL